MIEIKRGSAIIWSGNASGSQYRRVMQEDRVEVNFKSVDNIDFKVGDTIEVYGDIYKMNRPANISKSNTHLGYNYNLEFEALYYDLGKYTLFTLDKNNELTEPNVYLMSDARTLLGLVLQNANRAGFGWSLGIIDDTEVFQWGYSSSKILSALQDVANKTGLELWFDGKTINLTIRQPDTGVILEFGKGKGLYEINRSRKTDNEVTHLYVYGGSRNIPNDYGFYNLQPLGGNPIVNPNFTQGSDVVEASVVYENLYPKLNASVTSVISENVIRSLDIDFNLNDHLLDNGLPAQIVFITGKLVGFTFNISEDGFDNNTKQITFNRIVDDPAYPDGVPNNLLKPDVGDKFVLLQISMPNSYVQNEELKLKNTGEEYFNIEDINKYNWLCKPTPKFILENNIELKLGGVIRLKAADIGFDSDIRIDSYIRDLQEPHRYEFTLSNLITISKYAIDRNRTDNLINVVNRNLGGGMVKNSTYAEKAGYAERAGRADVATHAATADTAGHANTSDLATHSLTAGHANTSDLATRALRADLSDNSILWNGLAQPNYLTQPVRPLDSPKFEGIGSQSYVSGWAGHGYALKKDANGDYLLELDRLSVRKDFSVHELIVNQIRATNGSLWVSDGIKIDGVTVSGSNFICSIDTDGGTIYVPFAVNDIVRCQVFNGKSIKYYSARVTAVTSSTFTIVKIDGASNPASGDELVRIGNTTNLNRQGALYLTASDSGAPYLDVIDGVNSASFAGKTKVRLGKLDGITDPDLGALSGYGGYMGNFYGKGVFIVRNGSNVYTKDETSSEINIAKGEANQYTQQAVEGIEIGGRNYLPDSNFSNGISEANEWLRSVYNTVSIIDGKAVYSVISTANAARIERVISLPKGEYTVSIFAKLKTYFQFETFVNATVLSSHSVASPDASTLHWCTFRVEDDGEVTIRPYYRERLAVNDTIEVDWFMLVAGNKPAIDWNPNPEDITSSIDLLRTETLTEFSVLDGKISSKVSQTEVTMQITTAKNEAIGTASSDATSKANSAKSGAVSDAKDYTDGRVLDINSDISNITTRITTAETSIDQNTSQILLRATKTELTNQINDITVIKDTRNDNQTPAWYYTNYPKRTVREFKLKNVIGITNMAGVSGCELTTYVPWLDSSGGDVVQEVIVNNILFTRSGNSITWTGWVEGESTAGAQAKATLAETNSKTYTNAQITIVNNSISLKADRSVTDGLNTRMNNAEAKITPDAINLTVSSQIDTKVDNIEVGSNNLLGDSNFNINYGTPEWVSANGTRSKVSEGYRHNVTGGASRIQTTINLNKGDYVISARVKSVGGGFVFRGFEGVTNAEYGSYNDVASDFVIIKATFSVENDNTDVILRLYSNGDTSSSNFTVNWIVLLSGNKAAMAWTPSFSDYSTTEATKSSFNMTDNNISLLGQTINLTGLITFQATNAQNAANTADGKAVSAQNTANAANGTATSANNQVNAWKYPNKTTINGGAIETKSIKALQIDVDNLFAQTVTATDLTVSGSSKIAGFKVVGNSLDNANTTASLKFNDISGAGYLRINEQTNSPLLNIRTDTSSRTGISVQTYGSGTTGLYIINNANTGMSGGAIRSYGSHGFYQRQNEYWSAPGVLAAATLSPNGSVIKSWSVAGLSISSSKSGGTLTVTHNLGHTDYIVIHDSIGGDITSAPIINNNNFTVTVPAGITSYLSSFMMIGRNKVITS